MDCPLVKSTAICEAGPSESKAATINDSHNKSSNKRKASEEAHSDSLVKRLDAKADLVIARLKEIRQTYFPEILFLMKTMYNRDVLVDIQVWLGYDRVYTVEPVGKSGEIKYVDNNLFDIGVQFESFKFYISCIYGDPIAVNRPKLWERITRIGMKRKESWCMLGDFNDILHNGEKLGGPLRKESAFTPFGNMIKACDMKELSSNGNAFTWGGMRTHMWIQCKLDRSFGNKSLHNMFPASNQVFLEKRGSDHRPVLPGVKQAILQAWHSPHPLEGASVSQRLRICRKALSSLKKQNNSNSKVRITQLQFHLKDEHSSSPSYWSQKCKERWAKSGDSNTKFFHASVNANRAKKPVAKMLVDSQVNYFSSLFSSLNSTNLVKFSKDSNQGSLT
ncbi:hypothetical protein N665_0621s0004 [Sinapis alba]|nr:hypothetical protein N665_0621s0004 [Sinapis alba]